MFTKNQIDNWLELYELSDNRQDFGNLKAPDFTNRPFLKRDLLEAKVMIDRWNNVTTDWIFHSSKKEMIKVLFPEDEPNKAADLKAALKVLMKYADSLDSGKDLKNLSDDELVATVEASEIAERTNCIYPYSIWGANVHFTDDIAPNKAIGLSLNKEDNTLSSNDSVNLANSIIVFEVP
jgi:hypothetical protein